MLENLAQGAADGAFIVNQKNGRHDLDTVPVRECCHHECAEACADRPALQRCKPKRTAAKLTLGTTSG